MRVSEAGVVAEAQSIEVSAPVSERTGDGNLQRSITAQIYDLLPYLLSLVPPITSIVFLVTGPHRWWLVPLALIPITLMSALDSLKAPTERRGPDFRSAAWPYTTLVYLLAALHFVVIYCLVDLFARQGFFSLDMYFVALVVGGSSSLAMITAHELIHRKGRGSKMLGRMVLCTLMYEHFYTEHLRGHHVRVATDADPATARFGETFSAFWRRTIPGQLRSALDIEARRLNAVGARGVDRWLRNRVAHGWAVEFLMIGGILYFFGAVALIAFFIQAWVAVRRLEAANYIEHWGLQRSGPRVQSVDSWDTDSWLTLYTYMGLARHADHHVNPAKRYQELDVHADAPKLPGGYGIALNMAMNKNKDFIAAATAELQRCKLGPFATAEAEANTQQTAAYSTSERDKAKSTGLLHILERFWSTRVPSPAKPLLYIACIVFGASIASTDGMFLYALLKNAGILVCFVLLMGAARFLSTKMNQSYAVCVSILMFAAIGWIVSLLSGSM